MKVPSSSLAATSAASVAIPRAVSNFVVYRNPDAGKTEANEKNLENNSAAKATPKFANKFTSTTSWKKSIEQDAQALWRSLHRLVTVHPLVRSTLWHRGTGFERIPAHRHTSQGIPRPHAP